MIMMIMKDDLWILRKVCTFIYIKYEVNLTMNKYWMHVVGLGDRRCRLNTGTVHLSFS
jgi:hypothetical protein